ncbi:ATP-binding protein, partial [Streptomyces sp. URMC 123]|uniref:ATP-binding protein n=1 Tax=Streptomyces sp. URMC 123 TaxID=3423403 RepID=UPI003F1C26A8
ALLIARTRLLDPDNIATWDVPSDPAAVAPVRADARRHLIRWHLDDVTYAVELILSELITNAIRYGTPPVHARLINDRALTCEVSDSSSTSPHLRYAADDDEGGRGLYLIAHLSDHWGTRYSPRGKTIWTQNTVAPGRGDEVEHVFTDIDLDAIPPL